MYRWHELRRGRDWTRPSIEAPGNVIVFAPAYTAETITVSSWLVACLVPAPGIDDEAFVGKMPETAAVVAVVASRAVVAHPGGGRRTGQRDAARLADFLLQQLGRAADAGMQLRPVRDGALRRGQLQQPEVTALEIDQEDGDGDQELGQREAGFVIDRSAWSRGLGITSTSGRTVRLEGRHRRLRQLRATDAPSRQSRSPSSASGSADGNEICQTRL